MTQFQLLAASVSPHKHKSLDPVQTSDHDNHDETHLVSEGADEDVSDVWNVSYTSVN